MGQAPPRAPCFPFREGSAEACINDFSNIEDESIRRRTVIRALLGLPIDELQGRRELVIQRYITKIVKLSLHYATLIERDLHEWYNKNKDTEEWNYLSEEQKWDPHNTYSTLYNKFVEDCVEGDTSAIDWVRAHAEEYDTCLNQSSRDMSYYADYTGVFDYAEQGFRNFYFLVQDQAGLVDDLNPEGNFDGFPIFANALLNAPLEHLEYTWDALDA